MLHMYSEKLAIVCLPWLVSTGDTERQVDRHLGSHASSDWHIALGSHLTELLTVCVYNLTQVAVEQSTPKNVQIGNEVLQP